MFDTKHIQTRAVLKADGDDEGSIEAVFSTFNVVDRGGDIVLPGAIENGKSVPMVWSHDWSKPVGKGTVEANDERAVFKGSFFMDTVAGLDAYRTVKAMGDLQEFSWGFLVQDADWAERDGQQVRLIKRTEIFEVSPVLVGEGRGTHTLSLKHGQPLAIHADALEEAVADFVSRVRGRADYRAKEGRTLSSANRERLASIARSLSGAAGDLDAILKDTEPSKEKSVDLDALYLEFMLNQARLNGVQA